MYRSQNAGSQLLSSIALLSALLCGCQHTTRDTVRGERYGSPVAYEHALHGELAAEQENYGLAVRHFEQALAADPDDPYLRIRLATTMVQSGASEGAAKHIEKTLKNNPQDETTRRALAKYYEAAGEHEKAAPQERAPQ